MIELKRCPLPDCLSRPELTYHCRVRYVECQECGAHGPLEWDEQSAIHGWNALSDPAPVIPVTVDSVHAHNALQAQEITNLTAENRALRGIIWRITQLTNGISEIPGTKVDNWKRTQDGTLRPFISHEQYATLREDDRFLYNAGIKPEGLT